MWALMWALWQIHSCLLTQARLPADVLDWLALPHEHADDAVEWSAPSDDLHRPKRMALPYHQANRWQSAPTAHGNLVGQEWLASDPKGAKK
jgi:hypothetical protein